MTVSSASGKEIHPRLPWVEIARLLATLVVIMQHVPSMGFPPNQWLIGPALATFFLLAGYFSASGLDEQGPERGRGAMLVLLRPYLFWCAAYWLAAGMPLAPGSLASVFGLGTCPMLTPMWFLRDLMMFTLAAFLLSRFRPALYAFGLFCLFLHRWDDSLAWPSPYMFGDFALGVMLASAAPGCLNRWGNMPLAVHGSILFSLRGSCLGKLYGLFPDCGRLFSRIDCSGLPQLRNYCKGRQPRLVGKAGPVGVRQVFRVLFPYFCSDSPDGRRELFSLPMVPLGRGGAWFPRFT